MAYTQDQLDELRRNMAKGIRRAQLDGQMVEFASLEDMRRQERKMERALNPATGKVKRVAVIRTASGW